MHLVANIWNFGNYENDPGLDNCDWDDFNCQKNLPLADPFSDFYRK